VLILWGKKAINRLWHLIVSTCILKCWSRNRFVSWSQAEDIYSKFCVKCTLWRLLLENCPVLKYYRKIDKFICKSHVQRTDISELPQSESGRFSKKLICHCMFAFWNYTEFFCLPHIASKGRYAYLSIYFLQLLSANTNQLSLHEDGTTFNCYC